MKLAIVIAEYGRPAPDVSQYRECWPDADIQVFSGNDLPETPELDPAHPRYGWRMNDYWKVRKMLDSGADVAMCFDADMRILDRNAARTLPLLAERFELCLPMNPRYLQGIDNKVGADAQRDGEEPETMTSVNCSPIAIDLRNPCGKLTAQVYCDLMLSSPARGPLVWSWAMWASGFAGLTLAPQWCVCEKHIGVGGEIIIHEGHESVKRHYGHRRTS